MRTQAQHGRRRSVFLAPWVALLCGCGSPAPSGHPVATKPIATDASASGHDPDAADEALRDLLLALQDRFRCNGVSGCPAHAQLVAMGWTARAPLEQVFLQAPLQAPWRTRTVAILAELADPQAEALFLRLLDDRDPEVRARAIAGLGRVGAKGARQRIWEQSEAEGLWLAPARVAALQVLAWWGDATAARKLQAELPVLAGQPMGTAALVVAADLCRVPPPAGAALVDCTPGLVAMARHPVFHVRKAAVTAMAAHPVPQMAAALRDLQGDQAGSIRRQAGAALGVLAAIETAQDSSPAAQR